MADAAAIAPAAAAPEGADTRPELQYHTDKVFVGSFPEGTDMSKVEAVVSDGRTVVKFKSKTKVRKLGEEKETVENAFVAFESAADAEDAIAKLNGTDFEGGKGVRVELQIRRRRTKKPRKPRAGKAPNEGDAAEGGSAPTAPAPAEPANPCKIIMKALASGTTEEQVRAAAEKAGEIQALDLISRGRWRCFVTYATPEIATAAAASLDGVEVNGATVKAEMEAPKPVRAPRAPRAPKVPKPQDPTATFVGDVLRAVPKDQLLAAIPGATNIKILSRRSEETYNCIVTLDGAEAAAALQAKHGTELCDGSGVVRVEAAKPRLPR